MAFLTAPTVGERQNWSTFAANQLQQVRCTLFDLTDEQVNSRPTVSEFTLGTLVDHVIQVTGNYALALEVAPEAAEPQPADFAEQDTEFSVDDLTDRLEAVQKRLVAAIERVDLDADVPAPDVFWIPEDVKSWSVRWVLAHILTEIARHAGHADIIRETIDGKGAYELNARVDGEQWPPAEWS